VVEVCQIGKIHIWRFQSGKPLYVRLDKLPFILTCQGWGSTSWLVSIFALNADNPDLSDLEEHTEFVDVLYKFL
jgi:transcription initiation factor IIF auxiliary subunit